MKQIGVIFEEDDVKELEYYAKEEGRKISQHVRYICLQYLKDRKQKEQSATGNEN